MKMKQHPLSEYHHLLLDEEHTAVLGMEMRKRALKKY